MSATPATAPTRARLPRVAGRTWWVVVLVGFVGQLAWTVENMYLNVFVYDTITTDPTVIAVLVAASAVAATLSTMVVGAWSDRVRRRRPFIAIGYILWGLTTATFGFVQPSAGAQAAQVVGTAVVAIILLDCVMSVFGSGANDAAFNAWVTDATKPADRGRVDSVLSVLPLMSMLLVFGLLDGLTQAGEWKLFFGIIGLATAAVGVLAWFLVRDAPGIRATPDGYRRAVVHGLRLATMRAHPRLYTLLVAWAIIGISSQVFFPYLIIYIQRYLRIDGYPIVLASVLTLAAVISVVGGRLVDRVGKTRAILPAVLFMIVGLVGMFVVRDMLSVIVFGTVMMGGFLLSTASLSASVRDATPSDRIGMVQGLRMIFVVLIPMVIGPFIGSAVIIGANETYVDLGVVKQVPTPWIFPAAAVVALFVVVPLMALRRLPQPVDAA
ncbi:MFS transporter [Microbacterium sp. zg.Y1090]|uniref:MFS transporter n=1 Tax=Microbacterium TaxID=33882 RepID=UPI00214BDD40|nr:MULTISPECIES: MFS transporter [unclassified Microbacterium]MCR2812438.1 MFS transporter [Microbacterium sp. zg.Y1084]MCR2817761.1 MFS transporter [Microbacterium sp. zg.Y1090]MDL5485595.1 MFS transporter [Microbacterium sp. zg-Y1211]WIM28766.1 MFS transporter [Microbacterium sp. zg-Y1090]